MIAVILVNYNTRELTERALAALEAQECEVPWETWVVDNASTDGSVERIRERFPNARLIENSSNVGFAAANNQVLGRVDADAYLLLNTDTEMRLGALAALWKALEDPRVGMAAAALVNPDASPQASAVADRFPWSFAPVRRPEPLRWACGAALLVRGDCIRQIGLLDEAFFYMGEDCDWCLRARRAQWQVLGVPEAVVMHLGGATRKDFPLKAFEGIHLGRQHYYAKHHGFLGRLYGRLQSTVELTGEMLRHRQQRTFYRELLSRCWSYSLARGSSDALAGASR